MAAAPRPYLICIRLTELSSHILLQEVAAIALLRLRHVLLLGRPEVLGPVQHGIVPVLKSAERQPSLGDLHGRQLVLKNVCRRIPV